MPWENYLTSELHKRLWMWGCQSLIFSLVWCLLCSGIDPNTYSEPFRKNLLHLPHWLGNACHNIARTCKCSVNTHSSRLHTGSPSGCAAYGSVWLLLGVECSLYEPVATNQSLTPPSQGSKRILGRVRGLFLVLMMDTDAPLRSATFILPQPLLKVKGWLEG